MSCLAISTVVEIFLEVTPSQNPELDINDQLTEALLEGKRNSI